MQSNLNEEKKSKMIINKGLAHVDKFFARIFKPHPSRERKNPPSFLQKLFPADALFMEVSCSIELPNVQGSVATKR